MAKSKKKVPKDELLDQLLDDVNDIIADPSLPEASDEAGTYAGEAPVGLTPTEERIDETKNLGGNLWSSIENQVANSSDSLDGLRPPADPVDFPFAPAEAEGKYQGPSAGGNYQSMSELNDATRALNSNDDRTMSIASGDGASATLNANPSSSGDHDATVAADGFARRKTPGAATPQEKVVIGSLRGSGGSRSGNVFTNMDASLAQAENLKLAQQRILDIERENDRLRQENEEVASAAEIIRNRLEEMTARITSLDREKAEVQESAQNEVMILKGNLQFKESEVAKLRLKVDELDTRLRNDFKKIRVKERELENRLELARAEKGALIRAKDENILDLKRKVDQLQSEIDNYREKCLELNKTIESHQEQFKRTVRALRLALTNLEAKDENIVPLKKAD